jgi:hypothetical protein
LSQTSFVPQLVPLEAAEPVSTQTDAPDEQKVVPSSHALPPAGHAVPAVHGLHWPSSQTSFVPQSVPSVAFEPVSRQTETPVVHDVRPVWHAFAGVHARFETQEVQEPLSQTSLVTEPLPFVTGAPHDVPLVTLPLSVQTEVPVAQDVAAVWQGFEEVQVVPAVQVVQEPLSQTAPVPQVVPLGRLVQGA